MKGETKEILNSREFRLEVSKVVDKAGLIILSVLAGFLGGVYAVPSLTSFFQGVEPWGFFLVLTGISIPVALLLTTALCLYGYRKVLKNRKVT